MERVTLHSEGTSPCSFKSAASVPIRSLKAHFIPTQNGSGDPSPSNVQEIVGRTSLDLYLSEDVNLFENAEIVANSYRNDSGTVVSSNNSYYVSTTYDINPDNLDSYYIIYNKWNGSFVCRIYFLDSSGNWISRTQNFIIELGNSDTVCVSIRNICNFATMIPQNYGKIQFQFNKVTEFDKLRLIRGVKCPLLFPSNSKNRLDTSTGWVNNQNYEENTGRILSNGGARDNKYTAVIPGKTYTMSWTTYGYDMRVVFYRLNDAGNKVATRTLNSTNRSGFTFTVADNEHFIRVSHRTGSYTDIPAGLQLEFGSTATAYEAYSSDNTFYGGYVDPVKGVIISNWRIIDLGEQVWIKTTQNGYTFFWCTIPNGPLVDNPRGICSHYKTRNANTMDVDKTVRPYGTTLYGGFSRVAIRDDTYINNTDAEFKEAMSGVMYAYESIVDDEFPLDSVSLYSFEGRNYIWSTEYRAVEVDYDLFETKMIQDAKKRSLAYNQPHLESKTGSIVSFIPHVRAPIKQLRCEFNPIQDLHGYDYPWPAGGGKNILDMADANIVLGKYISNAGVESTNSNNFYNNKYIPVKASTAYTLSMSEKVSYCSIMEYDSSKTFIKRTLFGDGTTAGKIDSATVTMGSTTAYILIGSNMKGSTLSLADVQAVSWQVEEGSTATSWVPYENVCPIDGWTGVNVTKTGANIAESEYVLANTSMYSAVLFIEADLKPSTTYTLSFVGTAGNLCYTNEKLFAYANVSITGLRQSVTFTTKAEISRSTAAQYYSGRGWIILKNAQAQSADNTFTDVQLEVGSSATDYELYSGAVYNVEFPATKNVLPFIGNTSTVVGVNISYDGDCYILNGTTNNVGNLDLSFIPNNKLLWKIGTRYTLSAEQVSGSMTLGEGSGITFAVSLFDSSNKTFIRGNTNAESLDNYGGYGDAFESSGNYRLYFQTWRIGTVFNNLKIRVQIEEGSTITPYEPYGTIYGGYLDLIRGIAVSTYKMIDMGSIWWGSGASNNSYQSWALSTSDRKSIAGNVVYNGFCPILKPVTYNEAWKPFQIAASSPNSSSTLTRVMVSPNMYSSATEAKEAFAGVKLIYELETPIEYQLTPTQLKAFKDQNNIWSDLNGNTTVKYWTH